MNQAVPEILHDDAQFFADKYGTDVLTARLLMSRDITDAQQLKFFLNDDLRITHNPFVFSQMDLAAERIALAAAEGEKVLVFGDRDADGITATVLMTQALRGRDLEVFWEVPMGDEHYGLQIETIQRYAQKDVSLIVAVDCGIGNVAEVQAAAEAGIDCIIIDHHNPSDRLPEATAIINPKVEGEPYPFQGLSAVALVSKLVYAMEIAASGAYNQVFCFLNLRPGNDSIIVEAVKIVNFAEVQRITETFVSGAGEEQLSRVVDFIRDQAILVYQEDVQRRLLSQLFGQGVDIALKDISQQVWKSFPALRGKSLLRMLQGSKLNKFSPKPLQEIDAGVQLIVSYLHSLYPAILESYEASLDLVCLGLIADMMPLLDENRILVRRGLKRLEQSQRPGLKELMARLELLGRPLTSHAVSWKLTPVINATGRMGQPDLAVKLLLGEGNVASLADQIVALNRERRELGATAWEAVYDQAQASPERYGGKLCVVSHSSIHRGITGILAGRLSRSFSLPAFVLAELDEHIVGSVRSSRGFHVTDFLGRFADIFDDFGGHDAAGGFHLPKHKLGEFQQRLADQAQFIELTDEQEQVGPDLLLDSSELTEELEALQMRLEPTGMNFPPISYQCNAMRIENAQVIGKEQTHLRMALSTKRRKWPALYWSAADRMGRDFELQSLVDCVFTVERNYFAGNSNLQLTIISMEPSKVSN